MRSSTPCPLCKDGHLQDMVATLEALRDLAPLRVLACHDRLDGDPCLIQKNLDYFRRVREAARAHGDADPQNPELIPPDLPFEEFCDEIPREVWDFYREAHFSAPARSPGRSPGPARAGKMT